MKEISKPWRFVIFYLLMSLFFVALTLLMLFAGENIIRRFSSFKNGDTQTGETNSICSSVCILLDAGHGGEDGGAVGVDGTLEKVVNLQIAERVYSLCRIAGIPVAMTRTDDRMLYDPHADYQGKKKMLDLRARLSMAEELEGSILISIHQNSFSQSQYHGLQVYYSPNHPSSAVLAEDIQSRTRNLLQPENTRKTKAADSAIYLLNRCTRPAVLVECGFLSNPEECRKMGDEQYLSELATVIFFGIVDYLQTNISGS